MRKTVSVRQQDAASAAARELRAQEKLARALCQHIPHLVEAARARDFPRPLTHRGERRVTMLTAMSAKTLGGRVR